MDDLVRMLLAERWKEHTGETAEAVERSNRAVALYEAGRWAEAAEAFEEVLRREGPGSEVAPPALFSLGACRLALAQDRRAVEATALFLELGNEEHPFYWDGVQNVACAAGRLRHDELSLQLYRVMLGVAPQRTAYRGLALALGGLGRAAEALYVLDAAQRAGERDGALEQHRAQLATAAKDRRTPTVLAAPRWSRERILRAVFRTLGWRRPALPPSTLVWWRDG